MDKKVKKKKIQETKDENEGKRYIKKRWREVEA